MLQHILNISSIVLTRLKPLLCYELEWGTRCPFKWEHAGTFGISQTLRWRLQRRIFSCRHDHYHWGERVAEWSHSAVSNRSRVRIPVPPKVLGS